MTSESKESVSLVSNKSAPNYLKSFGGKSELAQGEYLRSTSGAYYAVIQPDGNFVVYKTNDFVVKNSLWSTGTSGRGVGPYRLALLKDNNLVVYDSKNTPLWNSNTVNNNAKSILLMQNDGNLVLYNVNQVLSIKYGKNNV